MRLHLPTTKFGGMSGRLMGYVSHHGSRLARLSLLPSPGVGTADLQEAKALLEDVA